jgi:hypothetical protein
MNLRRKRAIAWLYRQHAIEREFDNLRPLILGLKAKGWRWSTDYSLAQSVPSGGLAKLLEAIENPKEPNEALKCLMRS